MEWVENPLLTEYVHICGITTSEFRLPFSTPLPVPLHWIAPIVKLVLFTSELSRCLSIHNEGYSCFQPCGDPRRRYCIASHPLTRLVEVFIKNRRVLVRGPRGTLRRDFSHQFVDIRKEDNKVVVELWFGLHKNVAVVRSICTHIKNMMLGVSHGYRYKMRFVYAHFPINVAINKEGKKVEVRNFLGEKRVRHIHMLEGVTVMKSEAQKDEIILEGNDVEKVSTSGRVVCGL